MMTNQERVQLINETLAKVPEILRPILIEIVKPGNREQQTMPGLALMAEGMIPMVGQQLEISKDEFAPYLKAVIGYLSSVARGADALMETLNDLATPKVEVTEAGPTVEVEAEVGVA